MNFNTALFLFLFLPIFFIIYFVAQPTLRRWVGLAGGLIFYSWGQVYYLPLMAVIIGFNYFVGRLIGSFMPTDRRRVVALLWLGILFNAGLLVFYKSLVTFGFAGLAWLAPFLPARIETWLQNPAFPLGLSYISFQTISYLVDLSNGSLKPEKDILNFSLYIFLFPKILAGPITRYASLASQLSAPASTRQQTADGIRRFIQGFAKKILIADVLAKVVHAVFDQPSAMVTPAIAWLALIAYALQIYYDFSGYTDMAVGLAKMMGFQFIENFNYPYISQSVSDFWRRWHISLSSWFRDYVFYPLERRRIKFIGQPFNLLIVFLLTGLWHGLTLPFIAWGLLHGFFMALEALFLARWLQKAYRPIRHLYALGALLLTWLFFRSPSPAFALEFLARLAGNSDGILPLVFNQSSPLPFIEPSFIMAFGFGIALALPLKPALESSYKRIVGNYSQAGPYLLAACDLILLALFILSVGMMTASRFLPGIYGNF